MFFIRVDESHRARPHLRAPALHGQLNGSFPDQPHFTVWRWRCGGWGAPPGGRVVSWTSTDSPVASLPLRTSRITAEFDVRGVSFSKGYIAEGSTLPSVAFASAGRIAGSKTAGVNTAGSRAN